ncbi:MAG: cation:proton antiporter, partial [Thaumarchaeota archaeon]|nr:cation:proton antiporter [Nitrososphaerota archaeon]
MAIEAAVASTMDPILRAIVTISVLIFFAKIMASVFSNMKLPAVLGELIAGVVFGPYALGSGIIIFGEPLVVLNEYVDAFAEIGAIMILFSMGLEMGLTSLKENGAWAALIAALGDLTAFVITYEIYIRLGFSQAASLFIAAIMVATSLAISARVLEDLDMLKTEEGTLLVNAVAIDDILSVALLAVVTSIVFHGNIGVVEVARTIIIFFIIWLAMVAIGAFVLPRMIERFMMLETEG